MYVSLVGWLLSNSDLFVYIAIYNDGTFDPCDSNAGKGLLPSESSLLNGSLRSSNEVVSLREEDHVLG